MTNIEQFLSYHNPAAMLDKSHAVMVGTDGSITRLKDRRSIRWPYGSGYVLGGKLIKIVVADLCTAWRCEGLIKEQFEIDRSCEQLPD